MPKLTINQQAIVDHRSGNLLVSAGAGSGKTFVLTEHVINRITDSVSPIRIDRLLIVTFTKAAASEMRERIGIAIGKAICERPEDTGLKTQQALLSRAQICTIDSFCSNIVKNFFHSLDRESDYRVADEGELALISRDVFKTVLEKHYSEKDKDFYDLIDNYTNGKGDDSLYEIIKKFCENANVCPNPLAYFNELIENTEKTVNKLDDISALKEYADIIREDARGAASIIDDWSETLVGTNFENTVAPDLAVLNSISGSETIEELLGIFQNGLGWGRKRNASKNYPDTEIDNEYKEIRESIKKNFAGFKDDLGKVSPADIIVITNEVTKPMVLVAKLALEYYQALQLEKQERNVVDFSDIEHMALQIIQNDSKACEELRASFDEIMIDEYQDSNDLQEAILSGISTGDNMFMVGDVKQSIYAFRNAKPKLFTDKYKLFSEDDKSGIKIDLQENFRCRKEVIDGVNEIFCRIMTSKFGQVDYKKTAKLIYGSDYPKASEDGVYRPEIICIEKAKIRDEAKAVANRIRELMGEEKGLLIKAGKDTNELRKLKYGDIAILCRKTSGFDEIKKELANNGIPSALQKSKGFFETQEISLLINILNIIDNPMQDIPLVAVLASPVGGFTPDELAFLRQDKEEKKNISLYASLLKSDNEKAKSFVEKLRGLRDLSVHISINELIDEILKETGYEYYAAALPLGQVRKVNIEILKEMAQNFEKTSYHGLFDFIRYIKQIKINETDMESAQILSDAEDVVRLMTVHSSKGLEFPVVILMDNSSKGRSENEKIFLSSKYGLSSDYYNEERSIKVASPVKAVSKALASISDMEEVSRLLYVAMTRAREKLIVTYKGVYNTSGITREPEDYEVRNCKDFGDLIMAGLGGTPISWDIYNFNMLDAQRASISSDIKGFINKKELSSCKAEDIFDNNLAKELDKKLGYKYKFEEISNKKSSYSVSELKKLHNDMDPENTDELEKRSRVSFSADNKNESALIGTAYHLIFEKIDPLRALEENYISGLIASYVDKGLIEMEIADKLDPRGITGFYSSEIGEMAVEAYKNDRLFREKAFVLGDFIDESISGITDDDRVIIQGVIDMFFYQEDDIILVDYKSDNIKPGDEAVLANRYKTQLDYYGKAIYMATGKTPKKRYLYSIRTGRFAEV